MASESRYEIAKRSIQETTEKFGVDPKKGLSTEAAANNRAEHEPNLIVEKKESVYCHFVV